jgi:type I restriction enzyme S subunit
MSDGLPLGWAATTLDAVGYWHSGSTPSRRNSAYFGEGIPWVKSGDLPDGSVLSTEEQLTELGLQNSSAKLMPVGTISMALYGATIGKLGVLTFPAATNQACVNVVTDTRLVEPQYLFWYLLSQRRAFVERGQGGAQPNISQQIVRSHPIRIAPLNEQRRIVSKLEKLLDKVDSCQKRLAKIPILLKRFRQALLAAACSGRLTEDWREENAVLAAESTHSPDWAPEVPVSWTWKLLSEIAQLKGGVTKGRKLGCKESIFLPYLRVANVQDGFLDLSEIKHIEALPEDQGKYRLEPGDILFTEGGDRDKLGRGTVWRGEIPNCIHQNHIFRARLCSKDVSPDYVSIASKSDFSRRYFFENASQTVNLASINLTMLSALPLPLPPLPEQQEIVRRVNELFSLVAQIESRYEKSQRVRRCPQAIDPSQSIPW